MPQKAGEQPTTLAAAEAAFGAHVLRPAPSADGSLDSVYYAAATPLPASAKPGSPATRDAVELIYSSAGVAADITEVVDPTNAPLTIDAVEQDGAMLKASGGLGQAAIETVGGSPYVVGRSADGSLVEWIIWKSASGVIVTVHLESGLDHDAALAFAASFE